MFGNHDGINVIKGELVHGMLHSCNADLFALDGHKQKLRRVTYKSHQPSKIGQELDLPDQNTKTLRRLQDEEARRTWLTQQGELTEEKSLHI